MRKHDFYTLKGYDKQRDGELTPTLEDYMEMIYRCATTGESVRINHIAQKVNVRPSSASKMVQKLKELGYVEFEPYARLEVTEKGLQAGEYLLHRHDILHRFFCFINHSAEELELVEKIEHFFDAKTVENIERILSIL